MIAWLTEKLLRMSVKLSTILRFHCNGDMISWASIGLTDQATITPSVNGSLPAPTVSLQGLRDLSPTPVRHVIQAWPISLFHLPAIGLVQNGYLTPAGGIRVNSKDVMDLLEKRNSLYIGADERTA